MPPRIRGHPQHPQYRIDQVRDSHWVRTAIRAYLSFPPDSDSRKEPILLAAVHQAFQLALVDESSTTTLNAARIVVRNPIGTDYALRALGVPVPHHDNSAGAFTLPQCTDPLDTMAAGRQLLEITAKRRRRFFEEQEKRAAVSGSKPDTEIIDVLGDSDDEAQSPLTSSHTPMRPAIKRPRSPFIEYDSGDLASAVTKMSRTVASHSAALDAHAASTASQAAAFQAHLALVMLLKDERDKNIELEKEVKALRAVVQEAKSRGPRGKVVEEMERMRAERDAACHELATLRASIATISKGFESSL